MENNYYDDVMNNIQNLIAEQKWKDALFLIQAELNVPYVPTEIEAKLEQFLVEVQSHLTDEEKTFVLTDEQFVEDINSDNKNDRIKALMMLEKMNAAQFIPAFTTMLQDEAVANDEKTLLVIQLHNQKINHEFSITKFGKTMTLNPSTFALEATAHIFNEVIFIFNKIYDAKDVTIQNHFAELVMILINDYIPFPVPFGPWEIAISTLQVVSDLFGKGFNKLTYINDYELDGAMIDEIIAYHQQLIQN
jgi:hypothetical protein